jgi:hypothetical protein
MVRSNQEQHQPQTRPTGRRRGVALLLVLGVVAMASVLSWAMLSAASLRAQLDTNVRAATESKYLADSGISYAMYYLRYPEKSPVALTSGPYNNFFAGQSGLNMWEGARGLVNVSVTNTARNTFVIRSTALVDGITQTSEAEVAISTVGYAVDSAAAFGGSIQLPSNVSVTGLVTTTSQILNSAGTLLSWLGGTPISVKATAVPAFGDLLLVKSTGIVASTGGTDRTYTINGVNYIAEKAPATITGTLTTSRPTLNPGNVWYSDEVVTINNATINGTLVLRCTSKDLMVQGTNTLTTKSASLPALVVGNDVHLAHASLKAARLNVQGVTYVGDKIQTSGSTLLTTGLSFQGSLIMGATSPKIEGATGPISIAKTAATDTVKLVEETTITGITINRWSRL